MVPIMGWYIVGAVVLSMIWAAFRAAANALAACGGVRAITVQS